MALSRRIGNTTWIQTGPEFIESGKWEEGADSDGDSVFRKVTKSDKKKRSKINRAAVKKSARITNDDYGKLVEHMDEWFGKEQEGMRPMKSKKPKAKIAAAKAGPR